jgi:beta-N-acetylhexosaminidase
VDARARRPVHPAAMARGALALAEQSPRRRRLERLAIVALLAAVLTGCVTASPTSAPSPTVTSTTATHNAAATATPGATTSGAPTPGSTPTVAPSATPAPTQALSCTARVLATLTEEQRIGQLFMVGLADDRLDRAARDAISRFHIGSWWFTKSTSAGVDSVRAVADAVQSQASNAAIGGIGFLIAANQEGGRIQALAGPGFDTIPSALVQGSWPAETLRTRVARWGRQLLAAGVNLDFAPVADIVPEGTADENAPIGQLERQYGSESADVASHVAAFIEGMAEAGVATTAKHFPGLGRVAKNTDFASDVVDTVTTADDAYLLPFRRAVDAGVPAVMLALATYEQLDPDRIAAFSWPIIGGMLEDDLHFAGIVMSDSLSAEAVSAIPAGTRAVRFIANGGDMIVVNPVNVATEMAEAVAAHARESEWFRRRIDNAVLHVLRTKEAEGLLPCGS